MKAIIPTHQQVKRGLQIYEQIEQLQNELANLFGVKSVDRAVSILSGAGTSSDAPKRRGRPPKAAAVAVVAKRGRENPNADVAASSAGSQEDAEMPKRRGRKPGPKPQAKKAKRTISEAHRQAIKEAQQRRWAAKKGV